MAYQIFPLKGFDGIEFGMTRDQTRTRFSMPPYEDDLRDGMEPRDWYFDLGIRLEYDLEYHLQAAEFFAPAQPVFNGVNMLSLTVAQAHAMLTALDPSTVDDGDGSKAYDLAIGTWSEDEDDLGRDAPLTTFLIGKTGYYDEFRPGAPEMDIWDIGDKLGDLGREIVREDYGERPYPKKE
ncbi:hypothetical protein [Novosphingobium aerophilum]|uniref:Uncharacterized protein n=1 Tax=Novosphingobium aerophilum TaxID=2839843 RepID=A0A7X1KDE8_9SPHN|nr:hypothetical protein [Novosphingobium aerophilum]MBC2653241.1 hypothetical protein [Novosphingobium aerophilum]